MKGRLSLSVLHGKGTLGCLPISQTSCAAQAESNQRNLKTKPPSSTRLDKMSQLYKLVIIIVITPNQSRYVRQTRDSTHRWNDSQTDTASKHLTSGHHKHDMQVLVMFILCQSYKTLQITGAIALHPGVPCYLAFAQATEQSDQQQLKLCASASLPCQLML